MYKRQRLSTQQVMNTLFETEDGISSEDEDDFDDELSWYESEPEMEALSDSNSKIDGSDTEYEDEDDSVGQEVRRKDGYLWKTEPKNARRTPRQNIVRSTPGPKCIGLEADTPLKSFELFFDDSMLSPQAIKQIICSCRILPEERTSVQNINQCRRSGRKRCFLCPRSKDKKYRFACSRCHNNICEEHSKMICNQCQE